MQDVFYEETARTQGAGSASRKFYFAKVFMVISYVLAVIWGILSFTFIYIPIKNITSFELST